MNMISINGRTIAVPNGKGISIDGNTIYVDGVALESDLPQETRIVLVGDFDYVESKGSIAIEGDVKGDVKAGTSVKASNIEGNVKAGTSVTATNILGNTKAGTSITMGMAKW